MEDWTCSCGKKTDTVLTISEWCEQFDWLKNEADFLESFAEEEKYDSDICEDCFKKLVTKAGLNCRKDFSFETETVEIEEGWFGEHIFNIDPEVFDSEYKNEKCYNFSVSAYDSILVWAKLFDNIDSLKTYLDLCEGTFEIMLDWLQDGTNRIVLYIDFPYDHSCYGNGKYFELVGKGSEEIVKILKDFENTNHAY